MTNVNYSIQDNLCRMHSGTVEVNTPLELSSIQYIASIWYSRYEVEGVVGSDLLITVDDTLYRAKAGATSQYQIEKVGEYLPVTIKIDDQSFKQTVSRVLVGTSTREFMKSMVWLSGWLSGEAWSTTQLPDSLPDKWVVEINNKDKYEVELKDKESDDELDAFQYLQVSSGIKKMLVYKISTKIEKTLINESI